MRKKAKEEMFVQVGLRRNGRIVKNEQFSLEEFSERFPYERVTPVREVSLFNRIFKGVKVLRTAFVMGYCGAMRDLITDIKSEINKDNFGRSKK